MEDIKYEIFFQDGFLCYVTLLPLEAVCQIQTKKSHSQAKIVTINDTSKNLILSKGQTLILRLENQVDGGYHFNLPQYNPQILHLFSHLAKSPPPRSAIGHPGSDVWEFSALRSGKTDLRVTSSRPWAKKDSVPIFNALVIIK